MTNDKDKDKTFLGLMQELARLLKPLGFSKTGQKFFWAGSRRVADTFAFLEVQRARHSSGVGVEFTVNVGVGAKSLIEMLGGILWPPREKWPCILCARIGMISSPRFDGNDVWWTIPNGENRAVLDAAREAVDRVERDALPIIRRYKEDGQLLDALISGEPIPGCPDSLRPIYIIAMLAMRPEDSRLADTISYARASDPANPALIELIDRISKHRSQ